MKILKSHFHPDVDKLSEKIISTRLAARAIIIKESSVLLLQTKRYDDYSLPGGGLEENENPIKGMVRELQEETGAKNIKDIKPFGIYEEYRPWNFEGFNVQHMISYCYTCSADKDLGSTKLESYEVKNGMTPLWIDITKAINHNKIVMKKSLTKGLSVERETFLLELIKEQLLRT